MTRKRARSLFYQKLRAIATNYEWKIIDNSIRGRFRNPRDPKGQVYWPLFCPLTATYNGNKMNERVKLSEYKVAGELLKLDPLDSELIAHSADFRGHSLGNKQVRKTLMKCVGLKLN